MPCLGSRWLSLSSWRWTAWAGFEDCDASKLYRHFVDGKAVVDVSGTQVTVTFPRRAHNPVLRAVDWNNLPSKLLAPAGAKLSLRFA